MGENLTERCSAYVVIPAPVFYDRDLPPNARLLYGLISNLCNDRGYCWARNETLARYLDCKERSVRDLLGKLKAKGYIHVEQIDAGGATNRRITMGAYANRPAEKRRAVSDQTAEPPGKNLPPPGKNPPPGRQKFATDTLLKNNLSKNNTPLTPQGEGTADPPELEELEPELREAVLAWLSYKTERRQAYKPTGLQTLITRVRRKAAAYSPEAVTETIYDSMANGYQGIMWQWLRPEKIQANTAAQAIETDDPGDWY